MGSASFRRLASGGYIRFVLLNAMVRRLAAILAFPAAFAVPVTAVAHGEAHEHATLNGVRHRVAADEHHDEITGYAIPLGTGIASFSDSRDSGQHPHLRVDATVSSRIAPMSGAAIPALVLPFAKTLAVPGVRGPFVHPRVRAHGTHAPPPSLRSPPALIG
jgi:hypothetical protein